MDVANKEVCPYHLQTYQQNSQSGTFQIALEASTKMAGTVTLMTLKGMLSKEVTKFEQYSEYKDLILRILLWYVHTYGDYLDILYQLITKYLSPMI